MRHFLALIVVAGLVVPSFAAEPPAEPLPPAATVRIGAGRFLIGVNDRFLSYSNDAKTLLTAGADGKIRFWNVATGREIRSVQHPNQGISYMRSSPDGKLLGVADGSGNVAIWDAATGETLVTFRTGSYGENPLAWTSDSKRLVLATRDMTVRVIDAETGVELASWQVTFQKRMITGLIVSPDDKQIVVAGHDRETRVTDFNGKETLKLEAPANTAGGLSYLGVGPVAYSPDGKWLAASFIPGEVPIWDAKTGKVAQRLEINRGKGFDQISTIAFSPDSQFLAAANTDSKVRVFALASGRETQSFTAGQLGSHFKALVFSPDGKQLAGSGVGPALHIWDLPKGKPLFEQVGHSGSVVNLTFLADGRLVSMGQDGTLRCWDSATGKELDRQDLFFLLGTNLAADADGRSVKYVTSIPAGNYGLYRWTPGTGQAAKHILGLVITGTNTQLTADGRYGVMYTGQILQAFDAVAGKILVTYAWTSTTLRPSITTISPDGRMVAFADTPTHGDRIVVWDTATSRDRELASGSLQNGIVRKIAFTPDGRGLLTTHNAVELRLWDLAARLVRLRTQMPPATPLQTFAFSQDGRLAAIGTTTGAVCLFDAITGTELGMAQGHKGAVEALAFSRDGSRLASGSSDATLIVWEVAKLAGNRLPKRLGADATAAQLNGWWNDLGSKEGHRANVAVWRLSEAPAEKVVSIARAWLKQPLRPSTEQIEKWIKDLDDEKFAVRDRASRELAVAGGDMKTALENARKKPQSPETQSRLDKLLQATDGMSASTLRAIRVVEVLDRLGTSDSRKLLEEMANQSFGDDVRRELDRILKPQN